MAENKDTQPRRARLSDQTGWQLRAAHVHKANAGRSPAQSAPAPAKSATPKPQQVQAAPLVSSAATSSLSRGAAHTSAFIQRLTPVWQSISGISQNLTPRTKRLLATAAIATAGTALTVAMLGKSDDSQEHNQIAQTSQMAEGRIMGTGAPYERPESSPSTPSWVRNPHQETADMLLERYKAYQLRGQEAYEARQRIHQRRRPHDSFESAVRGPKDIDLSRVSPHTTQLIATASYENGLNPLLLPRLFVKESGFNPYAKSDTTAAGMCQFTEQTFLATLYREGDALGFGSYADKIMLKKGKTSTYYSAGRHQTQTLNLRYKPEFAVPLCAAHIRYELDLLNRHVGRPMTIADSAISHFTGWGVAKDIIKAYDNPREHNTPAYLYAEKSNYRGSATNMKMFFQNGNPRHPYTVAQFYERHVRMVGNEPALATKSQMQAYNAAMSQSGKLAP